MKFLNFDYHERGNLSTPTVKLKQKKIISYIETFQMPNMEILVSENYH